MAEIIETNQHPSGNLLLEIVPTSGPLSDRAFESHLADAHNRPRLRGTRGFVRDGRWAGVGTGPECMTLHELEVPTPADHTHADTRSTDPPNGSHGLDCRAYRELDPCSGRETHEIGSAILHVQVIVDPRFNDPFLRWYIDEHVPAVLDAPGMIGARRFEQILPDGDADPNSPSHIYRTVYEMADTSVIQRPETLAASLRGACPAELEPFRKASNQVYKQVFREVSAA